MKNLTLNFLSITSSLILIQAISVNALAADTGIPESVYFKDEELDLLGDGIRREFLLDVYEIGFYSDVRDINNLVLDAAEFPLAIRIKVLTNLLPDDPPSHWETLFRKVLNDKQFELFLSHYSMLQAGDVLAINFRPEKGSSISMRGKRIISINDKEFIKVVINGFIGSDPVSTELKNSILNS